MAMIGERPLLWHVMRYYAHYGHTEFVLCLGYGASGEELLPRLPQRSNDFVLDGGDRQVELLKTDIEDWRITFVDTGIHSAIGERLRRVRRFVDNDEMFLANYGDVLTDAPLPDTIPLRRERRDRQPPRGTPAVVAHVVDMAENGIITRSPFRELPLCENGGYFTLRQGIFDLLDEGEDLVNDALHG